MRRTTCTGIVAVLATSLLNGEARHTSVGAQSPDCQTAFTEPFTQPLPGGAEELLLADLNNDDVQDLLVSTSGDQRSVSVLFGNGTGFGGPTTVFPDAGGITVADFNSDGQLDVVVSRVASDHSSSVTVLFGDGAGGFPTSLTRAVAPRPFGVTLAGDVSQDGHADLVLVSEFADPSTIVLLPGDGAGNFGPLVPLQTGLRPTSVAAGDFNDDGRRDLAVATADLRLEFDGFVELRLANVAGGFDPPVLFKVGWQPTAIIAADFNEDGALDLVTGNFDGTLSVLLGDGAGGFAPQTVVTRPTISVKSLVAADFDGDGHLDLADEATSVLLGDGTGGFTLLRQFRPFGNDVKAADVNADGRIDLVSGVDAGPPALAVLYGRCATPTDLSVAITESRDPVLVGHTMRYTFTVTNHGPEAARTVGHFRVSSPTAIQFSPAVSSQGECGHSGHIEDLSIDYFCDFGTLAPGGVATVEATGHAVAANTLTATASVVIDNPHFDPNPADNSDAETTTVLYVGGVEFNLGTTPQGGAVLSWNGGGGQAGFLIGRWAGGETTILPPGGVPLGSGATSFLDAQPVAGKLNCYSLAPVDAAGTPYGRSHLLCMVPDSASPPDMLQDFMVSSILRYTWSSPGGQSGYVVFRHPLDGSPPSHSFFRPDVTGFTGDRDIPECHSVGPLDGSTVRGHSSVLCVIPGFSTLNP